MEWYILLWAIKEKLILERMLDVGGVSFSWNIFKFNFFMSLSSKESLKNMRIYEFSIIIINSMNGITKTKNW